MAQVITIDASNLEDVLESIGSKARNRTGRILEWQLSYHTNKLAKKLNENAPTQTRGDSRYKFRLSNSFYVGGFIGARAVMTREPRKLALVTGGTAPHEILPLFKKALFWPGLAHPISKVGPPVTRIHPGTAPNDFVERTIEEVGLTPDPQVLADMIAYEITGFEPWADFAADQDMQDI